MTSAIKSPRDTSAAIDSSNNCGQQLDFSFRELSSFVDVRDEFPRKTKHKTVKTESGKYKCNYLRFNNNHLVDFEDFQVVVEELLEDPSELCVLDLSFNDILKLDSVLLQYKEIKMLYLQGNRIDKLEEIDKLASLPKLISLSLHGNPIEDQAGFRSYILSHLPNLKTLNCSGVTKADLKNASTWKTMYGNKKKKRRRKDDD